MSDKIVPVKDDIALDEPQKLKCIIVTLKCRESGHAGIGLPGCRVCDPIWDNHLDCWSVKQNAESSVFSLSFGGHHVLNGTESS